MSARVAVVTGSNKGIGLAIVRALCRLFQGDFHQLDVNDLNSIRTTADYFKEEYGGVDVLVNNAGEAFGDSDPSPFAVQAEVTLRTNFFAARDMLSHFLPLIKPGDDLQKQKCGMRVVFCSDLKYRIVFMILKGETTKQAKMTKHLVV
uniref:Carbonyl reductase 1 n=1 Tax=Acanthochromis polyacanthus TaxID=80966 RepID=A0A3Q1H002_9TELE